MNMTVSVETTQGLGRKMTITIPRAEIQNKIKQRLNELKNSPSMVVRKGFRQGNVPADLLQKKFGPGVVQEVTEEMIRTSFGKALEQEKLKPASKPSFGNIQDQQESDLRYHVEFEVLPEVVLQPFSAFKITKKVVDIATADLEAMLAKVRKQLADWSPVERAAREGDRLKVDFVRTIQGESSEPEEETNAYVVIGQTGNLKEIDAALIDKKAGETVAINVTYPDTWHETKVAGKSATLKVDIKGVEETASLSDEELFKKLNVKEGTLEAALDKVRQEMKKQSDDIVYNQIKEQIIQQLTELHQFELPKTLIDQEIAQLREEEKHHVHTDACHHDHDDDHETEANRRVALGLVVSTIIQDRNLRPDTNRIVEEVKRVAMYYGGTPEILKACLNNRQLIGTIEQMVLLDSIVDLIQKEATVEEVKVTFEELTRSE